MTQIPFKGTPEQEAELKAFIETKKHEPGCLMPVLQEAQRIYGYLPVEVQQMIADGLGVTLAEVYGVSTFYSQFTLSPKGKYKVNVCLGTACYVKGADKVLEAIEKKLGISAGGITPDGKFSIDTCRCVGACGLAPVVVINDDVYGKLTPDMVDDMLSHYID
ncbi:MAG: NAD(P)H-dependent oxidoreductase subunit E [Clostridia bacterium]|nr:NAD(P)H-dependent oxidoreductase subunit E [Clostridia bacterium]